ncbi:MAG: hypothetical protein HFH68_15610 [Lachnospiraceae bacterium]|nr:hypothetical protein [Lachnospiraceae bacterium]
MYRVQAGLGIKEKRGGRGEAFGWQQVFLGEGFLGVFFVLFSGVWEEEEDKL